MSRCIPITTCGTCPHKDHKGAFGNPAYVPVCRRAGKELPWEPARMPGMGRPVARHDGAIPDWCPLPKYEVTP